eukprot:2939954-Amphidinium_carterae.1
MKSDWCTNYCNLDVKANLDFLARAKAWAKPEDVKAAAPARARAQIHWTLAKLRMERLDM